MRRASPWADEEHRSWRWVPRRSLFPRRTFDAGWLWPFQGYWVWECKWGWGFHDLYPYRYRSSYYVVETLNAVSVATDPKGNRESLPVNGEHDDTSDQRESPLQLPAQD